jgi:hypothetical protein
MLQIHMKFAMRLALLAMLPCASTHAQDKPDVEIGTSLVCDTQKQVERYVALYKGDPQAAVGAVNAEANDPTACGLSTVAFLRGPRIATARSADIAFNIVRILVVGVETSNGLQAVQPAAYFTVFGVKEFDV